MSCHYARCQCSLRWNFNLKLAVMKASIKSWTNKKLWVFEKLNVAWSVAIHDRTYVNWMNIENYWNDWMGSRLQLKRPNASSSLHARFEHDSNYFGFETFYLWKQKSSLSLNESKKSTSFIVYQIQNWKMLLFADSSFHGQPMNLFRFESLNHFFFASFTNEDT